MHRGCHLLLAGSAFALASAAGANETIAYKYDGLGRLVRVERSGSANAGLNTNYTLDCAGNRAKVGSGAGVAPAPPPLACESTGPPGHAPPVAVNDSGSQGVCTTQAYSVLGNDSGTDLTLTSVTGSSLFSLASSTTIQFLAPTTAGPRSATYTVQDRYGATASATLTVTVTAAGGNCS
jgi:YD repeat-containing protein